MNTKHMIITQNQKRHMITLSRFVFLKAFNYRSVSRMTSLLLILVLGACIHKPDIQQGNVITQEVVAALSIGMKQNQVQSIAGKPLILDPFRSDRWEYVYSMRYDNHNQSQFGYVTLFFKDNALSEIKIHQQPLKEDDIRSIETSSRRQAF